MEPLVSPSAALLATYVPLRRRTYPLRHRLRTPSAALRAPSSAVHTPSLNTNFLYSRASNIVGNAGSDSGGWWPMRSPSAPTSLTTQKLEVSTVQCGLVGCCRGELEAVGRQSKVEHGQHRLVASAASSSTVRKRRTERRSEAVG